MLIRSLEKQGGALSAICVQECFFSEDNLTPDLIKIPNYELIPQKSKIGRNHGLAIYLRNEFKYELRKTLCYTSDVRDALAIDVKGKSIVPSYLKYPLPFVCP